MKTLHKIKRLHQILILDDHGPSLSIPRFIERNIESARNVYSSAEYKLWRNDEIRGLIEENFGDDVLYSYDLLSPYSYKADLAKYVILYLFGGLYIDLGIDVAREWKIPTSKGIAACRDVSFTSPSWAAIQAGFLWALPKRREFEIAIQYIVENCKSRFYGENPLYPTGAVLLGRSFVAALVEKGQDIAADDQYVGSCRSVTPDSVVLNVSYVSKNGDVIAFRNQKIGGDSLHPGIEGSNNYNRMWERRVVYGEKASQWNADDCLLHVSSPVSKSPEGISAPEGYNGLLSHGPYACLSIGGYRLRVKFRPGTSFRKIKIDIMANYQKEHLASKVFTPNEIDHDSSVDLFFVLDSPKEKVEFLVRTEEGFRGAISKFELEPIYFREWMFSDPALRTEIGFKKDGGISTNPWQKGRLVYGPYISLPKGYYRLLIEFSPGTYFASAVIQIATGDLHKTIQSLNLKRATMKKGLIETAFTLDQNEENVEFRLCVNRFFVGSFVSYKIFSQ
ncbi:hypothetical protein GS501_09070 [Saccharibacter sp. 17.LH.SD]|uniref:glycosyltransferase n=1 Tax=Saccharibacter sp. 17.LH.SD TaxID=2689393 RepID=UPI00136B2922|nr:glycosyltransferase [Saccharibacter sp. 17.LH.SD]MXV45182.1 hypothetical protein [Saccharibacter sp. 17.LH.SD]